MSRGSRSGEGGQRRVRSITLPMATRPVQSPPFSKSRRMMGRRLKRVHLTDGAVPACIYPEIKGHGRGTFVSAQPNKRGYIKKIEAKTPRTDATSSATAKI